MYIFIKTQPAGVPLTISFQQDIRDGVLLQQKAGCTPTTLQ